MNNTMMQFEGVAALFGFFAIIALFVGYKFLASSSWLMGWFRGNIGIAAVLLTGILVLCVIDIRSYKPMFDDKPVATLNLREISPQHFEIRLVDAMGVENRYSITGEQWQLSINQFIWSKRLSLGLGHGYRFNAISASSVAGSSNSSEDVISTSRYLDVWKLINRYVPNNIFVSTQAFVTSPQPLADAALYEVVPSGFDFLVKPLNELAKRAQPVVEPQPENADNPVAPENKIEPANTTSPESVAAPADGASDTSLKPDSAGTPAQ